MKLKDLAYNYEILKSYASAVMFFDNDTFDMFYNFIDKNNLIINEQSSRFTDQKIKYDNLKIIIESINNIGLNTRIFKNKDIMQSNTFSKRYTGNFQKPDIEKNSKEYDKLASQALCFFHFSNVLKRDETGKSFIYSFPEKNTIELKVFNELFVENNIILFMFLYYIKVLDNSNCLIYLNHFYNNIKNQNNFFKLKEQYILYIQENTRIKKKDEITRTFNNIFNIISYIISEPGVVAGKLTQNSIGLDALGYNKINFRDKKSKLKFQTRKNIINSNPKQKSSNKYKKIVKSIHSNRSEISEGSNSRKAFHAHHIFQEYLYPELSCDIENIICLTSDQHNIEAHPDNQTSLINYNYQEKCLQAKFNSIVSGKYKEYSLEKFINVLNIGFNVDVFSISMKKEEIFQKIREIYRDEKPQIEDIRRRKK